MTLSKLSFSICKPRLHLVYFTTFNHQPTCTLISLCSSLSYVLRLCCWSVSCRPYALSRPQCTVGVQCMALRADLKVNPSRFLNILFVLSEYFLTFRPDSPFLSRVLVEDIHPCLSTSVGTDPSLSRVLLSSILVWLARISPLHLFRRTQYSLRPRMQFRSCVAVVEAINRAAFDCV